MGVHRDVKILGKDVKILGNCRWAFRSVYDTESGPDVGNPMFALVFQACARDAPLRALHFQRLGGLNFREKRVTHEIRGVKYCASEAEEIYGII